MRDFLVACGLGLLFGTGLVVSMMVDPLKVLAFLDVAGDFDPSLFLVLVTALIVTAIGYRLVLPRKKPLLDDRFRLPEASAIDRRLILGAALFGIGWGISGLCPGPALTALGTGRLEMLLYVPAMALGLLAARHIGSR